jgi:hypothetical protein
VYARRGFVYRPAYVIQPDFLLGAMFVRSGTRAYYFGDYFEESHRRRYVPWMDYRVARGVYDPNYGYYRHSFAGGSWERGLQGLYAGRYRGDVPRPPTTWAQQAVMARRLAARKTGDTVVNKTVNITNIQNVTVLSSVRGASAVSVTGLARLGGADAVGKVKTKSIRVEKVSKEFSTQERRQTQHYRALVTERRTVETKAARSTAEAKAPVKVKFEATKSAPPRKVKAPAPPPPPERPKASVKDPPRGKEVVPPKDRDKVPPADKDRAVPKDRDKDRAVPKDRDKDKVAPPKDKDKAPPPPRDKDRDKAPPPRDKDKVVPPKDRDKPPPPPKPKDVTPPPKPKNDPPPKPMDVTPPPKPKDVTPPPPKPKTPPPPPKPKPKDKDKD